MTRDTADSVRERREPTSVDLPGSVASRVEARLPRTRFDGVDEYVAYVLEEVLARVEADDDGDTHDDAAVDEQEVQERLESLGYLE